MKMHRPRLLVLDVFRVFVYLAVLEAWERQAGHKPQRMFDDVI